MIKQSTSTSTTSTSTNTSSANWCEQLRNTYYDNLDKNRRVVSSRARRLPPLVSQYIGGIRIVMMESRFEQEEVEVEEEEHDEEEEEVEMGVMTEVNADEAEEIINSMSNELASDVLLKLIKKREQKFQFTVKSKNNKEMKYFRAPCSTASPDSTSSALWRAFFNESWTIDICQILQAQLEVLLLKV
jgi:DNA-directed RNA polymerase beta' subunit